MSHNLLIDKIITRRSIRRYTGEKIPAETINEIIRAAMYAPSAVNRQPWQFIVIDNQEIREEITKIHPHASFLADASHGILVCGDVDKEHAPGYHHADCGAATQNILLAAHSLGIGSCWIGIYPKRERQELFSKLFALPDHVSPYSLVSLGYPHEEKKLPERYKTDRIHFNRWGNHHQ